ncbi:iron ABC transporter periplasmic iron-binding protein [Campylobacter hyointestinalis]|uniref:Iron ABC transporter periplasmic iron-binding protein n=1 Tax=Campylobacter hyointestinalis subsp. hyointestinalis TaxID=91352 RepID=A0A9W5AQG5_CAMHY|nr:Fe(3+) ABC transporter substrate-binding protein [Campylobacter hyointestinalis]ANE31843.1 putative iron(III) ABC transporter, periplasmic iron-binding protein [Campylobacter hyointestinalis subsp. hyointestinalis LMG 9260]KEA44144.1 iron deficiency-induced protein A [Campylobacter hyointestinalis subsp. hyointestinalis]QKF55008.1 iron(III)/spermidine/putrescine ABC transporter, periplasmic substrate-binding protein [Campylobacter hyointestinalis subsp. hyointestinalis]TXK47758.1 Fe(3+) ABC 
MKKSVLFLGLLASVMLANEVNIYTARHYDADQRIYDAFEAKTGIKVRATQAKAGELIKKLEIEGASSKADIFITADIGNLYSAKEKGLLQSVSSKYLEETIPSNLRDDENQWFAVTKRARVIVYAKDKFDPIKEGLNDYEDLANPNLKDKLLIRSGSAGYNKTLIASQIAHNGEAKTLELSKGIVANFARDPKGADRDQIRALAAGEGLIAVVNTYYIGLMLNSPKQSDIEAAKSIGIIFPNQKSYGTHINISGVGLTKASKNRDNAIKFMEFLLSPEAQEIIANINYEYPVNKNVKPSQTTASFGEFKEDEISLNKIGENLKKAVFVIDQAGWK